MVKGTLDPRVECSYRSNFSYQVQTQILIEFHLQNLDHTSTSNINRTRASLLKSNFKTLTKPNLRISTITSTKLQQQNTDQTSTKIWHELQLYNNAKPCAQSLNKNFIAPKFGQHVFQHQRQQQCKL